MDAALILAAVGRLVGVAPSSFPWKDRVAVHLATPNSALVMNADQRFAYTQTRRSADTNVRRPGEGCQGPTHS